MTYLELVTRWGAPPASLVTRFRRHFVGASLPHPQRVGGAELARYESRAAPIEVPPGAVWTTATMDNLDGGPPLMDRFAHLDSDEPHLAADVDALAANWPAFLTAPTLVAEVHALLAGWGLAPLRTVTWLSRIPNQAVRMDRDRLTTFRSAVRELAEDYTNFGIAAELAMWRTLAARGEVWPHVTDETYAPGVRIAPTWVGRRVSETPNPFPLLQQLEQLGITVASVDQDEAVLWLP